MSGIESGTVNSLSPISVVGCFLSLKAKSYFKMHAMCQSSSLFDVTCIIY